jgi:ethanolamine ammonia-lyase small subunit
VANYRQNTSARIAAAWSGSRNYGLRILELAVSGIADDAQAEAAVSRQLGGIIVFDQEKKVRGQSAPDK